MGENEQIEDVVSPTESQSVDFSPIVNSLNELILKQGEIIESQSKMIDNQKKIIDYFIPTEEELVQLEKDKQEEQKQLQIQQEEELRIKEQKEVESQTYHEEIKTLLNQVIDNTSVGNEVSAVSSSTNYTLLVVIVAFLFFGLMYKVIKTFI